MVERAIGQHEDACAIAVITAGFGFHGARELRFEKPRPPTLPVR